MWKRSRSDQGANSMKIDESCINHNIARLVDEMDVWDLCGDDSGLDDIRIMMLGYIKGVSELGEALKEVLKA